MDIDEEKNGALSGIRVLDLSRVLAGPFCTMLLGDLGADIIKIETPDVGDDSRKYPPFVGSESAYFMNLNRNKRSITLNLKSESGKKIFFDLARKSDVIIENFRPGTMERLGIGHDEIKKHNPDIIYAAISGFGHTGPYRNMPGYDIIGQAMGGIMSITGWPDSPPTRTGTAIADVLGGLCACIGILSGLVARTHGHPGQKIDISLVDAVVSAMETILQIYLVEERDPGRTGNRYEFIYPYDSFKSKNGWVVIAIGNNKLWHEFCRALEREDLIHEKKFQDNADRVNHHREIKEFVESWTTRKTTPEIIEFLSSHQIPCAPIYTVKEVVNDEHIAKARKMFIEIEHPVAGKLKVVGSPIKMSETPPRISRPAPLLGQHTGELLESLLNYRPEQIEELKRQNIVG
jgi:CoA:oxalate CoA-transferase